MERTHFGQHEDCFGCKVQSVQLAPSAVPTRQMSAPQTPAMTEARKDAKDNANAWERGHVYDTMPNGAKVPFIDGNGSPIGTKELVNKPKLQEARKALLRQRAQGSN